MAILLVKKAHLILLLQEIESIGDAKIGMFALELLIMLIFNLISLIAIY